MLTDTLLFFILDVDDIIIAYEYFKGKAKLAGMYLEGKSSLNILLMHDEPAKPNH